MTLTHNAWIKPGSLRARPAQVARSAPLGLIPLAERGQRESLLYVPRLYRFDEPCPLLVMVHGAHGEAGEWMNLFKHFADCNKLILLMPTSTSHTWDGDHGAEVARLDRALEYVFSRYAIDPERLAIGGFSDGASYALTLGLVNDDLFTHVIAFSPGGFSAAVRRRHRNIFISHGNQDAVLSVSDCGRQIVARLRKHGDEVEYLEFDGAHSVPLKVAHAAVVWFLAARKAVRPVELK